MARRVEPPARGALSGAVYGVFLIGGLNAVVGLITGGPMGFLFPPGLSLLEALHFGQKNGLLAGGFGAIFGGAIGLYWALMMMVTDGDRSGNMAELGDFSDAIPQNWPRVFRQTS